MVAYQGLVAPPVFWPLLQFVSAGASLIGGRPADRLGPIETAIALTTSGGGPGSILAPEMRLLRGDILAAIEGGTGAGSAAEAAYEAALEEARRLGVRMSELRAATRLPRQRRPSRAPDAATICGRSTTRSRRGSRPPT